MLGRLLPLVGTVLLSRATTKVAGRHAGKLALALGVFELWRNYQRAKAPSTPTPEAGTHNARSGPQSRTTSQRPSRPKSRLFRRR